MGRLPAVRNLVSTYQQAMQSATLEKVSLTQSTRTNTYHNFTFDPLRSKRVNPINAQQKKAPEAKPRHKLTFLPYELLYPG